MFDVMNIREVIGLHLSQIPEKLFYTYSIGGEKPGLKALRTGIKTRFPMYHKEIKPSCKKALVLPSDCIVVVLLCAISS